MSIEIGQFKGVFGKISTASNRISMKLSHAYNPADITICRTIPGLTKNQQELCYQQPDTTSAALIGLQEAIRECKQQFQFHRWNCSSLVSKERNPYTSAILKRGYRETAFAYAILSAGVAISVARACSQGNLMNCGCDYKIYKSKTIDRHNFLSMANTNWKWGGCSHNLQYGMRFSKKFLDSRETAGDIHSKINLHNNQVGRMAVSQNMQMKCKCHGMSGSCELKTCWRSTPDYKQVGKILRDRYRSAISVDQSNMGSVSNNLNKNSLQPKKRKAKSKKNGQWISRQKKPKRDFVYDLLYYERSPNFCERDQSLDIAGTQGRLCNRTSSIGDRCSSLCCGRGYNLIRRKRIERCRCKFLWCCTVECDTCTTEEWISVCK